MEVNIGGKIFPVNIENDKVYLDNELQDLDMAMVNEHTISMLRNGKQTTALISKIDKESKIVTLIIDQQSYDVQIKDKLDLLLSQMGMSDMLVQKMSDLKSPMPGLVVKVLVEPGQSVKQGDVLILLEAMKMENSLKATADAVVSSVNVTEGESVEKGYTLISFE